MAKLYFRYGAMGSSKSASALMTRFNYLERGHAVLLLKPVVDDRDSVTAITSRIGLRAPAIPFGPADSMKALFRDYPGCGCIIVDEAQFATAAQIEELREIVDECGIPVFCYGLRTDFRSYLFEGSKRLLELADSVSELNSICDCGKKAIVNARYRDGKIVYEGALIYIGGNESYRGMCYGCWKRGNEMT